MKLPVLKGGISSEACSHPRHKWRGVVREFQKAIIRKRFCPIRPNEEVSIGPYEKNGVPLLVPIGMQLWQTLAKDLQMTSLIKTDQWIYVVIQDPGQGEQYLGQYAAENDISFIPVFLNKDDALLGMHLLVRDKSKQYEVQAVMFGDLSVHAAAGGFRLYVLDSEGQIIEKINT